MSSFEIAYLTQMQILILLAILTYIKTKDENKRK